MDKPRVSVIMNGYNGEAFLRQAIDSVLAQRWQDYACTGRFHYSPLCYWAGFISG